MIVAFLLGFMGSLHCLVMCGPLLMTSLNAAKNNEVLFYVLYHTGRICVYGLLGVLVGITGQGFSLAGGHQIVAIVLGVLVCLVGIQQATNLFKYKLRSFGLEKIAQYLIRNYSKLGKKSYFFKGVINGFLPCGLVYVALTGALLTENSLLGFSYMAIFGIGTLPILISLAFFNKLKLNLKYNFSRLLPWITILFGLWILIRGLGLGIPYFSPNRLETTKVHSTQDCSSPIFKN